MFHARIQRFDVTENLKKFYKILGTIQSLSSCSWTWMWMCKPCQIMAPPRIPPGFFFLPSMGWWAMAGSSVEAIVPRKTRMAIGARMQTAVQCSTWLTCELTAGLTGLSESDSTQLPLRVRFFAHLFSLHGCRAGYGRRWPCSASSPRPPRCLCDGLLPDSGKDEDGHARASTCTPRSLFCSLFLSMHASFATSTTLPQRKRCVLHVLYHLVLRYCSSRRT